MPAIEGFRSPRSRLGVGAVVVVLLAALAVTVGIGIWRSTSASVIETVAVTPRATPVETSTGEIFVHVSGAVREPGLYVLEPGSRVVDAIAAAGGLAEEADGAAVNLARPVADGEQLAIPAVGEEPPAGEQGSGTTGEGVAIVNVNAADQAELETLPRIGPALAQRILEWRQQNGGFTAVEDLLAVPGIGEKMLEALRPLVTV